MRGLTRDDDRGAVAVLVAVLLSGGVLLGMGALVIDVGLLGAEREELQSGADAAAWGVALACQTDPATCADQAPRLAAANAKDATAGTSTVVCSDACGGVPRARTAPCPPLPDALTGPFTEVRTTTRTPGGGTLIPPVLARGDGYGSAACSQVVWGPPGHADAITLGVSLCDWKTGTNDGADLPGAGQVLAPEDIGAPATGCGATVPVDRQPTAGYSWFTADPAECRRNAQVGADWPRPLLARPCPQVLDDAIASGRPIVLPLTDAVLPLSAELTRDYRIAGLAALEVTGYRAGADSGGDPCPGVTDCIRGRFTTTLVPVHAALPTDDRNYGATLISRIG
jgi:hypothetical protein